MRFIWKHEVIPAVSVLSSMDMQVRRRIPPAMGLPLVANRRGASNRPCYCPCGESRNFSVGGVFFEVAEHFDEHEIHRHNNQLHPRCRRRVCPAVRERRSSGNRLHGDRVSLGLRRRLRVAHQCKMLRGPSYLKSRSEIFLSTAFGNMHPMRPSDTRGRLLYAPNSDNWDEVHHGL
jgi:hypothetical protein